MTKADLRNLIAQDKAGKVIKYLLRITKREEDLHNQVVSISARYRKFLKEKHGGTAETEQSDTTINRINAALLNVIDQLEDNAFSSWNWQKVAMWIGIIAAIATITGYTLKDFIFTGEEEQTITQPITPAVEEDTLEQLPPTEAPAEKAPSTTNNSKNNVTIDMQDQAKVGNIITGDSNTIDIKQDF